jgi:prepilin-type N-terminal cleavage/methylation domain-containing protein/prepilin-type processing-associated H-X9-DG protein
MRLAVLLFKKECVAMRKRFIRQGFTLIELLVVIAIIAILVGLMVPAVQKVRESANRVQCQANLKQIGVAFHDYHGANKVFPPGYFATGEFVNGGTDTSPGWGWAAFLLPYLEQTPLFDQLDFSQGVQNSSAIATVVPTYICPSDIVGTGIFAVTDINWNPICQAGATSYAGCCGGSYVNSAGANAVVSTTTGMNDTGIGNGILFRNSAVHLTDITDGTSSTVLVQERCFANVEGTWAGAISGGYCNQGLYNPKAVPGKLGQVAGDLVLIHASTVNSPTGRNLDDTSSRHVVGANFLLADGSVQFFRNIVSSTPDCTTLEAMGTINGDEVLGTNLMD